NTPTFSTPAGIAARMSRAASGVTWRFDPGHRFTPIASAPAAATITASSGVVTPQIFTNTRDMALGAQQPAQRRRRIGRAHQRLADQHRVDAGLTQARDVSGVPDPGLRDDDP